MLACAVTGTAQEAGAASGKPGAWLPTEVVLFESIHFEDPDGKTVVVAPAVYDVGLVDGGSLKLSPLPEGDPIVVAATKSPVAIPADTAMAKLISDGKSSIRRLAYLAADGSLHEALGTLPGERSRGIIAYPYAYKWYTPKITVSDPSRLVPTFWRVGSPATIRWRCSYVKSRVGILLVNSRSKLVVRTIVPQVLSPTVTSYTWTVPDSIAPLVNSYQVVVVAQEGTYGVSPIFTIRAAETTFTVKDIAVQAGQSVVLGTDKYLVWGEGVGNKPVERSLAGVTAISAPTYGWFWGLVAGTGKVFNIVAGTGNAVYSYYNGGSTATDWSGATALHEFYVMRGEEVWELDTYMRDGALLERGSLGGVVDIRSAGNGGHALALTSSGEVWARGSNAYGQLGDGTLENSSDWKKVMDGVKAIAAGDKTSFAVKTDGTVWGWGYNWQGSLGMGAGSTSTWKVTTPTQIEGLSGISKVYSREGHTFAVNSLRAVWGWGNNIYSQLSTNTSSQPVLTPTRLSALDGATDIAVTTSHTLFVRDGQVWACGYNGQGQLGDGTYESRASPVKVVN
jgi:hypothetical protein